MKRLLCSLCLLAGIIFASGLAQKAESAPSLSGADQADISRIESYLNSIKTLRASFVQSSTDSGVLKGMIYLNRPGKMRIDYDPPNRNFVVADGAFLYFWDDELKQQTNAPLGTTMADVILKSNIRLNDDVKVTGITRSPNQIHVTMVYASHPTQGQITLTFDTMPLQLKKWTTVDVQGQITEVNLIRPEIGVDLPSNLFYFHNPKFKTTSGNSSVRP